MWKTWIKISKRLSKIWSCLTIKWTIYKNKSGSFHSVSQRQDRCSNNKYHRLDKCLCIWCWEMIIAGNERLNSTAPQTSLMLNVCTQWGYEVCFALRDRVPVLTMWGVVIQQSQHQLEALWSCRSPGASQPCTWECSQAPHMLIKAWSTTLSAHTVQLPDCGSYTLFKLHTTLHSWAACKSSLSPTLYFLKQLVASDSMRAHSIRCKFSYGFTSHVLVKSRTFFRLFGQWCFFFCLYLLTTSLIICLLKC